MKSDRKFISKEQIEKSTQLLRKILNNDEANITVNCSSTMCSVSIDLGIKGPVNIEYVQSLQYRMLSKVNAARIIHIVELSYNQYRISILGLPIEFFYEDSDFSVYASLQSCLNEEDVDVKRREIQQQISERVYKNIVSESPDLQSKYSDWKPKKTGVSSGLIFLKPSKANDIKNIYVKKLDVEEILSLPVFKIAKDCGVRAPKVTMLAQSNHSYLFSRDIRGTKNDKKYDYTDLIDYVENYNYYFDANQLTLFIDRSPEGTFNRFIKIDTLSIARLLWLCVVMSIYDIHPGNIGIVTKTQNGIVKYKLALIDFRILTGNANGYLIDDLLTEKNLGDFIRHHIIKIHGISPAKFLLELSNNITEDEYSIAFSKIADNFVQTYEQVKHSIDQSLLHFDENDWFIQKRLIETKKILESSWLNNFKIVSQKVAMHQDNKLLTPKMSQSTHS